MRVLVAGLVLAFAAPAVHAASYKCLDLTIKPTAGMCKGYERKAKYCVDTSSPDTADATKASAKGSEMLGYTTAENCKQAVQWALGDDCTKEGFCTATGDFCKLTSVTRAGPEIQCSSDADCTDEKFQQKQCCSVYKTMYNSACGSDSAKADKAATDAKGNGMCDDSDKCIPLPTASASSITPNSMVALAVSTVCALVMAAAS